MGTKMTKELGVYNEEEKVSTPLGSHSYRVLGIDPRSASSGITRTPIQVDRTPPGPKAVQRCESYTRLEDSEDAKSVEEIKDDSGYKEEKQMESDTQNEEMTSFVREVEQKFLETDLDQLDSTSDNSKETPPQQNTKPVLELFDVRSPSLQITRTPILVECTPELFALHSRIESLSFCDVDIHEDDPSAAVSESDLSPENHQATINEWLAGVDNNACDTPLNKSFVESPRQVARKQKELTALKKQLFFTPDVREVSTKPKARTPLGDIQAGQLQHSPQKLMRAKQWRNIQDERKRRGISDTENTPPSLPPLSKISSAPGKMLDRKRSKVNWDEENTMFI